MHRLNARERAEFERKNPVEEGPEFQIAPMIDILLVLMVFFMAISSTEVLQSNRAIALPVAKDGKSSKKNPGQMIVNLLWNFQSDVGTIEIDNVKFSSANQIVPRLRRAIENNPLCRVLIRSDRSVKYEYSRTILKAVGDAGVTNVTFSVVDKEIPGTAPPPKR